MKPLRLVLAVLVLSLLTTGALADVTAPQRTQGIKAPVPEGTHTLVSLRGPGKFISAQITKQGGRSDLTFIVLDIDGKNVVTYNIYTRQEKIIADVDHVVLAFYHKANDELYFDLKGRVKELHRIGDCVAPRMIGDAIRDGETVGRSL